MAFGSGHGKGAIEGIGKALVQLGESVREGCAGVTAAVVRAQSDVNMKIEAIHGRLQLLQNSMQTATAGQELRSDIARLHAQIEGWRAEVAAVRAEAAEARRAYEMALRRPEPAADPSTVAPAIEQATFRSAEPEGDASPGKGERQGRHRRLLRAAAGISSATLTCHRDLWAFFVERSAATRHFRIPGLVNEVDGEKVHVTLSGRTIIASLTALDQVRSEHESDQGEDWALASELYEAFADVVGAAGRGPRSGADGEVVIVIDRKPAAASSGESDQESPEGGDEPESGASTD